MSEAKDLTAGASALVTGSDIEHQIDAAHKYPRDIKASLAQALSLATMNEDVAAKCSYALKRGGKKIPGPSARFGEIILYTWGNARAGARLTAEGKDYVTAQGAFHDLEKNVAITSEVQRRIVDAEGRRFNVDLIGVTANATCSIAMRNAVLKGIPKSFWVPVLTEAQAMVTGKSKPLINRRADAIEYLQQFGVDEPMILARLELQHVDEITLDHISTLADLAANIRDGATTVEEAFPAPVATPAAEEAPEAYTGRKLIALAKEAASAEELDYVRSLTAEHMSGDDAEEVTSIIAARFKELMMVNQETSRKVNGEF